VVVPSAIGAAFGQGTSADQTMPVKVFRSNTKLFGPQQAEFDQSMKEVLFDFDIRETATDGAALCTDVQWLKDHPQARFFIEGYTDYRGGVVYNLALAQRRAETVRANLLDRGISADQIILTVGELYPPCVEQTESCWERSRRVRFVYAPIY
jgi:outer membrane protein OmpA-like peptidoglycan-associated protein